MSLPRIRIVPTASGASAVQVLWRYVDNKPVLDHIGSAHTPEELALLKSQAQRLIDGDQLALDFGVASGGTGGVDDPVPVIGQKAGYLLDAIRSAFVHLGLDAATGGDPVFFDLVAARIISPGSKLDAIETLADVGVSTVSYRTILRRLPLYAREKFRESLTSTLARHAGIGPGVLVLYDVTTLYFETDQEDELRKPGFSKERRLEPQITVGMLTDASGLPLAIGAFEGNRAETHTMLPMIQRFSKAYDCAEVIVIADAGMFNSANKQALVDQGLGYVLGTKIRDIPTILTTWLKKNPDTDYEDGQIWVQPHYGRNNSNRPHAITYYHYSANRARRTLKGVSEQLAKAEKAVLGKIPVKRNRYVNLKAPEKTVNYELVEKHRVLAGVKGYETNRIDLTAEEVIGFYRQLFTIEQSFRMAKSDLKARPIFHHKHESIEAHLTIVMAAMATGRVLEKATGLSLKRLVRTLKKYRHFLINIGGQTIHAHTPLPPEITTLLNNIPKPD